MPPPKDPPPPAVNESGEVPWDVHVQRINHQLVHTYRTVLLPIEDALKYDTFRPSWFAETIAQTKPFVTFLGPFSAGKSSFINYLLQGNFLQSGPQPTTDKFTAVMHGSQTTMNIPGRVLAAAADQPFRGLNQFGESFLDCFSGVQIDHPLLKSVTLIDTPGVLETGETHMRRYDYVKVCRWFVERSDLIFMMFDPTKLDAGTELRGLFQQAIKGNESKVRIVLNKADMVGSQDLMRVYGALFWNLSNLINTTEPPRVYVSSFWDKPYQARTNHKLFTIEKTDLLFELTETVPLGALDRRVANLIRRAQDVLIHAYVVGTIKQGMPKVFGKAKAKQDALNNLEFTYETLADRYKVALADFPDADEYRTFFATVEINDMRRIETMEKMGWIETLRTLINVKLPKLLTPIQSHASIDPRDRKHAIEMQRLYFAKMSESAAPPSAPEAHSVATNVLSSAAAVQCSPVPPAGIQPSSTPAVDAATIAALQIQNQQMMALLMQHMQNSNLAGNSASPSPSSPQQ